MSKSSKKKVTKFTFQSLIRLIIFGVIVFFIISLISGQKINQDSVDPTVSSDKNNNPILGKTTEITNDIYQSIPAESRQQLENLNQNPAVTFVQQQIKSIKEITDGFPQKQIKEIQKIILTNLYQNSMRKIDSQ